MIASRNFRTVLGVFLNASDAVVAFFLLFGGGFIANQRTAIVGYVSVGFGIALIYLSTSVWKKGKWKLVTRLLLYVFTLCVLLTSLFYFVTVKHQQLSGQTPLPTISLFFTVITVLSFIHLKIQEPGQPSE